jgi:septal ring factor EnvC (AmiA/AmiB activator)
MNLNPILERRAAMAALLAAAAAGVFFFRVWLEARDDRMQMQATIASQSTLISAAEHREQDRAKQLQETLQQIADLKRNVQTPQQVIREIPQYLPPLPKPMEAIPPPGQPGTQTPAQAGEVGQPDVRVPAADLKPLFDFVQDCRACQARLDAAHQDVQDEQRKNQALLKERDAAVKAARGGGFWTRAKRAAKWLAVGFAVGYGVRAAAR